ncbi:hypothetical protein BYT27DRAFT_6884805 [Phlegmacium glaucopus]|nr:hypothetical protein BYT27DRAFT_6884805 [Phlegmacium glaucopus]
MSNSGRSMDGENSRRKKRKFSRPVTVLWPKTLWLSLSQRILGHIVRFPPITLGAGMEGFTQDYAIVKLDNSKIEKAFKSTVIDLSAF